MTIAIRAATAAAKCIRKKKEHTKASGIGSAKEEKSNMTSHRIASGEAERSNHNESDRNGRIQKILRMAMGHCPGKLQHGISVWEIFKNVPGSKNDAKTAEKAHYGSRRIAEKGRREAVSAAKVRMPLSLLVAKKYGRRRKKNCA